MNKKQYLKVQERKKRLWAKFVKRGERETNKAINKSIKMISKEVKRGNNEIYLPYDYEELDHNEKKILDALKQKYSFLDFFIDDDLAHLCVITWRLKNE